MALNQDSIRGCDPGKVPHLAGPDIHGSKPGFVGVTLARIRGCDSGQVPHQAGPDKHGSQPGFVGVTLAKFLTKLVLIYMALNQDSILWCYPGQVPRQAGPDIHGAQPGFVVATFAKCLTKLVLICMAINQDQKKQNAATGFLILVNKKGLGKQRRRCGVTSGSALFRQRNFC
ncbi:hypothetical protein DPMN_091700 [Dreissena polymorpha]|uniref:Uncharacterized protein n=1 Tax=Dreissena polymorpha TaxID=45954 RepID=A0A9D4QZC4_DREPO|nr:hypothetical protein DPMN_091700 [Dreissena polymorpha]